MFQSKIIYRDVSICSTIPIKHKNTGRCVCQRAARSTEELLLFIPLPVLYPPSYLRSGPDAHPGGRHRGYLLRVFLQGSIPVT